MLDEQLTYVFLSKRRRVFEVRKIAVRDEAAALFYGSKDPKEETSKSEYACLKALDTDAFFLNFGIRKIAPGPLF